MKLINKIVCIILAITLFTSSFTTEALAAGSKTTTQSFEPIYADGGFRFLDVYGRDTFKITYDGKKVISCSASQKKRDLGSDMVEAGGIQLVSQTQTCWTYRAVWHLNFNVLPKPLAVVAKAVGIKYTSLTRLGRISTVVVTYKVDRNGKLSYSWTYSFQVPQKIKDTAYKFFKYFTVAF